MRFAPQAHTSRRPLRERWHDLARRVRWTLWWPLALAVALGTAAGTAHGLLATPHYSATSYLLVSARDHGDPNTALGFAQAYGKLATADAMLAPAARRWHTTPARLRSQLTVSTSPDAPMIEISGNATSARRAALTANEVARSMVRQAREKGSGSGVRLTVLSPAFTPSAPASPSLPLSVTVGASAGVLVGGLVLMVRPRKRSETGAAVPNQVEPGPEATAGEPREVVGVDAGGGPKNESGRSASNGARREEVR